MIFKSHFISMVIYAALASLVLALIRRNNLKDQLKYGFFLFLIMVLGAILFGWLMYLTSLL
ncbi:hypothetical protein NLC29_01820 [Candidatus Aminicenantes bacterium AH-873-B07]|nr:hypothetical protein [Candidatus Aminicenantes bacterium AH-873-B07]